MGYPKHKAEVKKMPGPTIFGREPAFYIGLIEAVLVAVLSFSKFGLSQDTIGVVMAVVTAAASCYTAYVTKQTMLGVGVGLLKAFIALFVTFGVNVTDTQQTALIALATVILGTWNRKQADLLDDKTQHSFDLAA
jgi:hypothetical protein